MKLKCKDGKPQSQSGLSQKPICCWHFADLSPPAHAGGCLGTDQATTIHSCNVPNLTDVTVPSPFRGYNDSHERAAGHPLG